MVANGSAMMNKKKEKEEKKQVFQGMYVEIW